MKSWPTPQDYNEAIQVPRFCFADAELKQCRIELNAIGLPKSASGTFASVYKATSGSTSWAVRCFLSNRPEQGSRYQQISDFVLFENLDATVAFYYLADGVKVRGHWYPCLKMSWVDGVTLDQYIHCNYRDTNKMTSLLKSFHQMVGELEGAGIGHGDLQHGNIMVTDLGLRLVDYDALFVPALAGLKSLEFGHPNYQHPDRTEEHYDPEVDNFSCWLIHASLLTIAIDPSMYEELGGGDDCILFKRKDLIGPESSIVFKRLLTHESEHIRETARLLMRMLWAAPDSIPHLGASPEAMEALPSQRPEKRVVLLKDEPRGNGNSGSGSTEPAFAFDAGYDAIADSVKEREALKRKPGARLQKLTQGTFRAGRQARDRIHKMAEKLELRTMPSNWIGRKINEATMQFNAGNYDEACRIFLQAFKQLDPASTAYYEVAVSLGYSFALNGNPSLASNYFFAGLNFARQNDMRIQLQRTILLLSICRFDDGNRAAAWKLFDDNHKHLNGLRDVVMTSLDDLLVSREATFKLLESYVRRTAESMQPSVATIVELVECASLIFFDSLVFDEESIKSYIGIVATVARVGGEQGRERAQAMLFRLADECVDQEFKKEAKLARFCGAVLMNTLEKWQHQAVSILSMLGHTTVEEFAELAVTASAYLEAATILRLLVSVAQTFRQIDSKSEAVDALRAACLFAVKCDPVLADMILNAIEEFDQESISTCLHESYLADGCARSAYEKFISLLATSGRTNTQTVVIQDLLVKQKADDLADIVYNLAARGDSSVLKRALVAHSTTVENTEGTTDNTIETACKTAVERCFFNLTGAESPLDTRDHAGRPWNFYYQQITAIDSFRSAYRDAGNNDRATALLNRLSSETYQEIFDGWFLHLVSTSNYDRYYRFVFDLADDKSMPLLAGLITLLVRNGQSLIIDGITRNLTNKEKLSTLIELSELLADNGDLVAYSHAAREIVRAASPEDLIAMIEHLLDCNGEGPAFADLLLKQLVAQQRLSKAAHVIRYLSEQNLLSIAAMSTEAMLQTRFEGSVFDELLKLEYSSTVAALTGSVANTRGVKGVEAVISLLLAGDLSDSGCSAIIAELFEQQRVQLERLLKFKTLLALPSTIDDTTGQALIELNQTMTTLHNLRMFLSRKNDPIVRQLAADGWTDQLAHTLSNKYDPLVCIWALQLARGREHALLNSIGLELAVYKKHDCISGIVDRLTGDGLSEALYEFSQNLVRNGYVAEALALAIQLAKHHTFESKTIITQIINFTNHESDLLVIVEQSAQINDKLTDMIVRHLGRSNAEKLKSIAFKLAQQGNKKALSLVLTQLVSTEDDFMDFLSELCKTPDPSSIAALASWLAESGLTRVIRRRVEECKLSGDSYLTALWSNFLPALED